VISGIHELSETFKEAIYDGTTKDFIDAEKTCCVAPEFYFGISTPDRSQISCASRFRGICPSWQP
jgi:hypothetical protein